MQEECVRAACPASALLAAAPHRSILFPEPDNESSSDAQLALHRTNVRGPGATGASSHPSRHILLLQSSIIAGTSDAVDTTGTHISRHCVLPRLETSSHTTWP